MLTNNKQQTTNNKQQTTIMARIVLKSKDSVFDVSKIF